jgi:hypothetical protein
MADRARRAALALLLAAVQLVAAAQAIPGATEVRQSRAYAADGMSVRQRAVFARGQCSRQCSHGTGSALRTSRINTGVAWETLASGPCTSAYAT